MSWRSTTRNSFPDSNEPRIGRRKSQCETYTCTTNGWSSILTSERRSKVSSGWPAGAVPVRASRMTRGKAQACQPMIWATRNLEAIMHTEAHPPNNPTRSSNSSSHRRASHNPREEAASHPKQQEEAEVVLEVTIQESLLLIWVQPSAKQSSSRMGSATLSMWPESWTK